MTGWALLWMLAAAGGLRVDTSTPDALCPDLGQVRAAAQARLGDIEGEGVWRASYGLIHRPDGVEAGDVVRLELHDPAGRLRLRRELPRAGESCTALARALVVVLDSYFRHPSPEASPASASSASGAADPTSVSTVSAGSVASPTPTRLSLDAAGGWAGAWAGGHHASPALILGLRLGILPATWSAGIEATALLAADRQTFGAATATLHSYQLRGFFARELLGRGRVSLRAGPEALFALDHADAGTLLERANRTRAALGGGLRVQLQLRLAARILALALVAIDYAPTAWAGTLLVENSSTETEVFPSARVRLIVAGGLSWAVF